MEITKFNRTSPDRQCRCEREGECVGALLIFFKYVKNDADEDSSKLYGIGTIASKFSADYMVTFIGPQRESSLVAWESCNAESVFCKSILI